MNINESLWFLESLMGQVQGDVLTLQKVRQSLTNVRSALREQHDELVEMVGERQMLIDGIDRRDREIAELRGHVKRASEQLQEVRQEKIDLMRQLNPDETHVEDSTPELTYDYTVGYEEPDHWGYDDYGWPLR